ncbi:ABC-F family ATP-binding cassette domain-containing protein [Rhizobium sp. TH2]|uniref:ABC-F family ATP-binding cassette domain-containing protein n=1 Tax=Rhizobium sp. TH2 TaxID=2775403 RepID=UPI0021574F8E|nr:ABC-F family ATP-binding cassette domain-containing protein [Rhizobium sp. TH2]UVC06580.1 ABC-F family ATP-binding cassette domain-containing protein [Rhizobium sp. TH2]
MPASITLSNLSWSTPEGRPLFTNLDLSFGPERTALIGRNGVGKSVVLRLITDELVPATGTVSVSGSIGTLDQRVQITPDETIATLFGAETPLATLQRAEAGEATTEELASADWTLEARMAAALARAGLNADTATPLAALSGGQRTRAALAALVFKEPDFLLLDEPTNNLDREGRAAVIDLLAGWKGGAVVVSHDRELLETVDVIVELTTLGATRYGGNWTQYRARKALELAAAEHDLADAEKRLTEVARGAQATAERKARKDSTGKRAAAKGDMPRILIGARKEHSENTSGGNARLTERLRSEAETDLAAARERIERLRELSVTLPSTGLPAGRLVLRLDGVTGGFDPGQPIIENLSFDIRGPDRIAVTGPNGSGKSTLLALITGALRPWSGTVRAATPFAMLDQQVSILDPKTSIRDNFLRINPHSCENACRAALARFMFRADAALQQVSTLSGGQLLRAGLACVLGGAKPPSLLILDEPTNHLDIDSIAAVEAGLQAYDGALLIVSHDEVFLDAVGMTRRLEIPNEELPTAPPG